MITKTSITELLGKNVENLKSYLKDNKIEAYRILNYQPYATPFAVDIYLDNAVVQVFEQPEPGDTEALEEAIEEMLGIKEFFYKSRVALSLSKGDTGFPKSSPKKIVINEYGNKFLINLSDYLDTGIFLDHRETRKWIGSLSKEKSILNTFAYTSSFSVYAAQGGAKKTHSVDLSKTYCEWTKKNFELNKMSLEDNWVLKMDTREYFKYAKRKNLKFDIIILDPPTFSRNKGFSFSVQKDHPALINDAFEILNPNGFILFSNNYKEFEMSEEVLGKYKVLEKTDSIPPDFEESWPHLCYVIKRLN